MPHDDEVALLSSVMNVSSALRRLGDDRELFDQIVQIFLEDAPGLLQSAHRALEIGDSTGVRRAAHSLKGLAATLSADGAVSAAYQLEHLAGSGHLAEASEPIENLSCRLEELTVALGKYCDGRRPGGASSERS